MKKSRIILIFLIVMLLFALSACSPLTPDVLVDEAKTVWGNAYSRTIKDILHIKNVNIVAPISATLDSRSRISTQITLDVTDGLIETERKIIGNTYYLDFVLKNLQGSISGDMVDMIGEVFKIDNLHCMELRFSGQIVGDKVTFTTTVTGVDKILNGAPPLVENVIFNEKTFDPVVTSVIKTLMQQSLFGTMPINGEVNESDKTYSYSYDDSDKINSEFMRLPKLLVDAIKNINFKPGWRTLAEILNNNFDTTDFVKIAKQYIKQEPVSVECGYTKIDYGYYFNKISADMDMSIPHLPKYFFGQILELIGVTDVVITGDCSAHIAVGLNTEMTINNSLS